MLKQLAEASGWTIPDEEMSEIGSIYNGTMNDTHPVRELNLGFTPPAILFEAGE